MGRCFCLPSVAMVLMLTHVQHKGQDIHAPDRRGESAPFRERKCYFAHQLLLPSWTLPRADNCLTLMHFDPLRRANWQLNTALSTYQLNKCLERHIKDIPNADSVFTCHHFFPFASPLKSSLHSCKIYFHI